MTFMEYCKREKKKLVLTLMISLVMVPVLFFCLKEDKDIYIMDEDLVVGMKLPAETETAELILTAENEGVSVKKEVLLKRTQKEQAEKPAYTVSGEDKLRTAVDRELRSLSIPDEEVFVLPSELSDGTRLTWRRPEKGKTFLLPLAAAPLLMLYGYRGEKDRRAKLAGAKADGIIRSLPEFNNKVVLLLGSGMVFDDVLALIARESKGRQGDPLADLIAEAGAEADALNRDLLTVLSAKASGLHIREFSRMVDLIRENRYVGADLAGKLSAEGEALWAGRKKRAEERGRMAETGLALPMSVTLLALVAVAAAPAMMQI